MSDTVKKIVPQWLNDFIAQATPLVEKAPAAVAFGQAVAEELMKDDKVADKIRVISDDVAAFAGEIEAAINPAPTP